MKYKNILEIVSENIDDGIFVVDKTGKVVFYNESADNQAGISFDSAVGKNILELFPKLTKETSTLFRVIQTGEPIIGHIQEYYNYRLKKVTIISTTYPIFENNQIVGAVEISKDMNKYREFNDKIEKINKNFGKKIIKEEATYNIDSIIGESKVIKNIKAKIIKIAESSSPVMVYGETGTGKEMVIQSIHNLSKRKNHPFIAQNCAAIPVTLLESILFGTSIGSFTGSKDSPGLFELADEGTLFLDEINSMDIFLQAKLLRVIQDGCIRRIGDKYTRRVNVRVSVAMNTTPGEALKTGKLREDLFYRLNVLNFEVPSLRERREDIRLLVDYFINQYNLKLGKRVKGIKDDAFKLMQNYDWPGNVRELQHAIEHGIFMTEDEYIKIEDLPLMNTESYSTDLNKKEDYNLSINLTLKDKMNEFEKKIIENALKENKYSITVTAKKLGIPRQTLHYKINNLNIKIIKTI
jgi:arginine utilization regulatory protein